MPESDSALPLEQTMISDTPPSGSTHTARELRTLAKLQRGLVFCAAFLLLAYFLFTVRLVVFANAPANVLPVVRMIPDILYWMAVAASMTLSFLIVRLLHATPVALALLLLLAVVPKLSILVLTLIYVHSARKLKAAGIQVGLRGVKTAQVP